MYNAYVTKLKNVRPHSNADRMLLADCFGNTICVGLNAKNGDIGVYFPTVLVFISPPMVSFQLNMLKRIIL